MTASTLHRMAVVAVIVTFVVIVLGAYVRLSHAGLGCPDWPGCYGQLTWPAEAPLPDSSPIRAISVGYPEAVIGAFGWEMEWEYGWMLIFFLLSIVFAFALRKPFKVTI